MNTEAANANAECHTCHAPMRIAAYLTRRNKLNFCSPECFKTHRRRAAIKEDLTGQRFGRLVITGRLPGVGWAYLCDCGREGSSRNPCALKKGQVVSCGCVREENRHTSTRTHGATTGRAYTREYNAWRALKDRCLRPASKSYPIYGGRGITVCDAWANDFSRFLADMGPCPSGMTIDRINNNAGYEPGNCRWASRAVQSRNTRTARLITHDGLTLHLVDWATRLGVRATLLATRIDHLGWTVAEALDTPPDPTHRRQK